MKKKIEMPASAERISERAKTLAKQKNLICDFFNISVDLMNVFFKIQKDVACSIVIVWLNKVIKEGGRPIFYILLRLLMSGQFQIPFSFHSRADELAVGMKKR